jgi:hypothetical protein
MNYEDAKKLVMDPIMRMPGVTIMLRNPETPYLSVCTPQGDFRVELEDGDTAEGVARFINIYRDDLAEGTSETRTPAEALEIRVMALEKAVWKLGAGRP